MARAVTERPGQSAASKPNHVDHEVFVHFESIQTRKNSVINIVSGYATANRPSLIVAAHVNHTAVTTSWLFGAPTQDPTPGGSARSASQDVATRRLHRTSPPGTRHTLMIKLG
jgi:hypothetical protein